MNERFMPDRRMSTGSSATGWYPDPDDAGGLRFWDGSSWSEHRARLAAPAGSPAVCSCGVAAIGRCRVCTDAYCQAHISAGFIQDRPFRRRWEPWTCGNCIEDGQREIRAAQLSRCENVLAQMKAIRKLRHVRTPNGKHARVVNLFPHPRKPTERPGRYATALLIEYDGGPPEPTYRGLALSENGDTVYDVGLPVTGVAKARFGPKRNLAGVVVTNEINFDLLVEAAARSTQDSWFEYAARSFLRAARHIGVKPNFTPVVAPVVHTASDGVVSDETNGDEIRGVETRNGEIRSVEVEHDIDATVQLQPNVGRVQPDPPFTPPLPLPHPQ